MHGDGHPLIDRNIKLSATIKIIWKKSLNIFSDSSQCLSLSVIDLVFVFSCSLFLVWRLERNYAKNIDFSSSECLSSTLYFLLRFSFFFVSRKSEKLYFSWQQQWSWLYMTSFSKSSPFALLICCCCQCSGVVGGFVCVSIHDDAGWILLIIQICFHFYSYFIFSSFNQSIYDDLNCKFSLASRLCCCLRRRLFILPNVSGIRSDETSWNAS